MSVADRLYSTLEGVRIALEALRSNKVRAALTIMGVAVGVFVVTAMAAAVHGFQSSVEKDIASVGPNSFFVFRRADVFVELRRLRRDLPVRRNPPITLREAEALQRLPVALRRDGALDGSASFKYKDRELKSAGVDAYTPNWMDVDGGTSIRAATSPPPKPTPARV